jgi:hypothetical protein
MPLLATREHARALAIWRLMLHLYGIFWEVGW